MSCRETSEGKRKTGAKPVHLSLSEEYLRERSAEGGEDEGRENDGGSLAASLLFAEQHDIAEARAGGKTGDQCAEADGAADVKLAE